MPVLLLNNVITPIRHTSETAYLACNSMLICKLPAVSVHACTCIHLRMKSAVMLPQQPILLYLSCNVSLREGTRPPYVQISLTLRSLHSVTLPVLDQQSEDLYRLQQEQNGNGFLIPVWLMLQFNDGQDYGPIRTNVAVQTQERASRGHNSLICVLQDVCSNGSQVELTDFRAPAGSYSSKPILSHSLPKCECRDCIQMTVHKQQQDTMYDTAGFDMLQSLFL